jgi:TPR repeat protein
MRGAIFVSVVLVLACCLLEFRFPTYARLCWMKTCYAYEKTDEDVKALSKLAETGDDVAQSSLALRYMTGDGVQQDIKRSLELFRRSAEQGNPGAEYALGTAYLTGIHISRDYVLGYMWLDVAALHGHELSPDLLTFLQGVMTKEQVAQAQKLVREWRPKVEDTSMKTSSSRH